MAITKATIRRIERHKNQLAKERDRLREILEDLESVVESTDEGILRLEEAIDILSQYV